MIGGIFDWRHILRVQKNTQIKTVPKQSSGSISFSGDKKRTSKDSAISDQVYFGVENQHLFLDKNFARRSTQNYFFFFPLESL